MKADDRPVDLNGRYFDALALLIRERGKLVTKDRFLSEVWQGVPVTDEAALDSETETAGAAGALVSTFAFAEAEEAIDWLPTRSEIV